MFFADLVGFTQWSASRTPSEVFGLLESSIYGVFDRIAARRKVFKVETIGDCYVAVTGVPEPQVDHAVIMAKFSTECLLKLRHVLSKMAEQFGKDTLELNMRIGRYNSPCPWRTPRSKILLQLY
jgi:class 3 adenylate cyclase